MNPLLSRKPLAIVLGAAVSFGAQASSPIFQATDLGAGYQVALAGEGKCGEGKCGEGMDMSGTATPAPPATPTAAPAADAAVDKAKKADAATAAPTKEAAAEGKCGESKCGSH